MLRGGHPNSLGRTVEAVELVLADPSLLGALIDTYASDDATVRLRVSSALNRISRARPELLAAVIEPRLLRFLESPRKSVAGRAKKLLDLGAES